MSEKIIALLVPKPDPARAATLADLHKKILSATLTLRDLQDTWSTVVEHLTRIDVKGLQPKLKPAYFAIVARLVATAAELRAQFDHITPSDLTGAVRAAESAKTDSEFTSACQTVEREVTRYTGKAENVRKLTESLARDTKAVEVITDDMWSESFVVAEPPAGFVADRS